VKELLPLCAGVVVGWCLSFVRTPRTRWSLAPVACIPVGALVSWINGELGSDIWPLFVSFDALVVWGGAILVLVLVSVRRRTAE
jgi:hypothetical protein